MSEPNIFHILEVMLNLAPLITPPEPKVKPGGYNDEMFLQLTDDEKDEFSCGICYQILRDTRSCENRHNFCYSCIYVWSTSGPPTSHSRCPVCRTDGYYYRYRALDEKINTKDVKCGMEGCTWEGPLKELGSHEHTTSTSETTSESTPEASPSNENPVEQPNTTARSKMTPRAIVRNRHRAALTSNGGTQAVSSDVSGGQAGENNSSDSSANPRQTEGGRPIRRRSVRTRTTSGPRVLRRTSQSTDVEHSSNSNSQSVDPTEGSAATGENSLARRRTTSMGPGPSLLRRRRGSDADEASSSTPHVAVEISLIPRPPDAPVPTNQNTDNETRDTPRPSYSVRTTDGSSARGEQRTSMFPSIINNSSNQNQPRAPSGGAGTLTATGLPTPRRRIRPDNNNNSLRDRLVESRVRLDNLMSLFSSELDRTRRDVNNFQEERERIHNEQLDEIRNLGERLGNIALELRRVLHVRRGTNFHIEEDDDLD